MIPSKQTLVRKDNDSQQNKNIIDQMCIPYPKILKSKRPKLSIKIGKYKLPKDFFSSKTIHNSIGIHRRSSTINENNTEIADLNQTPKFKQTMNRRCLFRSTRALRQNHYKINENMFTSQIQTSDVQKPYRQLSCQLKITQQVSSIKQLNKQNQIQSIGTHRSKLKVLYDCDWKRPKRLPPMNFNEYFKKPNNTN